MIENQTLKNMSQPILQSIVEQLKGFSVQAVFQDVTILMLVRIAATIIAGVIFLKIVNAILRRMVARNILSQTAYDKFRSVLSLIVYIVIILLLVSLVTDNIIIVYALLGLMFIIIYSSKDVITSIIAYYTIILTRSITIGSYISIDKYTGRIQNITPLFTEIRTVDGDLIRIPNSTLLNKNIVVLGSAFTLKIGVRVNGTTNIEEIEDKLRKLLSKTPEIVLTIKPEIDIKCVRSNGVEFTITTYIASPSRANTVFTVLAKNIIETLKPYEVEVFII
ncbi:MAG TPA: mechanosensitive ion channel [Desulfurococcales archaeon]|nr:mechanosensitive ion channel [Desulfurococcales archaeon]